MVRDTQPRYLNKFGLLRRKRGERGEGNSISISRIDELERTARWREKREEERDKREEERECVSGGWKGRWLKNEREDECVCRVDCLVVLR